MRDVIITAIIFGLVPFVLRSPRLGAYVWVWLSMMVPHRLTYGFARTMPFSYVIALTVLVGFLFSKERKPFPVNGITVTQLLFLFWMTVTSFFAINSPEIVLDRWVFVFKIHLMILVTFMLVWDRKYIDYLIWIIVVSVGFYGVKGGVWTLLTGGGGRVWGPPGGVIMGNNELGLALTMLIPLIYYLHQTSVGRWLKIGLAVSGVAICFAILGTQSRGALLAIVAMAFVLSVKGGYPVRGTLLISVVLVAAVVFMPDTWSGRMSTIQTYDQDASAMSRIYTWKTLWNLALDRPILGGGFATDNITIFNKYAPLEGFSQFYGRAVFVAHSIYFQALGEHGFPGLFLYLMLGLMTWRKAGKLARETKDDPELMAWVPLMMRMIQVSLIGFAVGGAFLTLVHFDMPYYIAGIVVLVDATLRERAKAMSAPQARVKAPGPVSLQLTTPNRQP